MAVVVPAANAAGGMRSTSYAELDHLSDRIAASLRDEGVQPGTFVALLLPRSAELIAAMLGVLKAGAAYVPLDPTYPADRLRYFLGDTRASVCLTSRERFPLAAAIGARALDVVDAMRDGGNVAVDIAITPESLAYVMYTSGSTGQPKGVVVPHRAITRLVTGQDFARLDSTRVLLHMAPASFDASTFEIWGALLNGARCVVAPEWGAGAPDPAGLRRLIADAGVTTIWLTASLFNSVIDHDPATLAGVAEVLAGGEALSLPHVRKAQKHLPDVQLINGYGPTEGTTFSCCFRIPRPVPDGWSAIPIGTAITGTTAHVLDDALADSANGAIGELYIGGDGLAQGYLNQPELTNQRFITHPAHGRLYRTGDRARVRADGTIEFHGRDDGQVKVRGYRVELGEIEAVLRDIDGIGDAVVALRADAPGEKRLVAYYTTQDCVSGPSHQAVRERLAQRLPSHMVPSLFMRLDAIPLTPNGKADRAALPAPTRQRPALQRSAVAPGSAVERWIASLWREVLQLDDVGVHDRFFELGGTSLTALRFLSLVNRETSRPIPAVVLFRAPTIAELAAILDREYHAALPAHLATRPAPVVPTVLAEYRAQRQEAELAARRRLRRGGAS